MPTDAELAALWLSMRVAAWSVALMLVPAIGIAWLLARRDFPGKSLVDAVVHLPLVLPPVVVGFLLLLVLGRNGWIGRVLHERFGIEIAFTWKAAAIAAAVMGFPLMVRSIRIGIELVDRRLEQAARTLGAGWFRVLTTVTLPLALPGLAAGVLLAFARSLGEFGATITFAGNIEGRTRTLPSAIYTYTQIPGGDPAAIRLMVLSIALALAAMIVSQIIARRLRTASDIAA